MALIGTVLIVFLLVKMVRSSRTYLKMSEQEKRDKGVRLALVGVALVPLLVILLVNVLGEYAANEVSRKRQALYEPPCEPNCVPSGDRPSGTGEP